ncbi:MAG: tetratricopeptide repeat protein [Acidimicrobiales bacterium]
MAPTNDRSPKASPGSGNKGSSSRKSSKGGGSKSSNSGGGYRERSQQERSKSKSGSGGRKSGGAPRRYSKGGPNDRVEEEGIPGNQQWGGLARKGVLRANLDERKEQERVVDAIDDDDLDEEALAKRAERERKRLEREARQAELLEQAREAVERASQPEGKPTKAKSAKRKPRPKPPRDRAPLPSGPRRNETEEEAFNRLLGPDQGRKQLRKLRTAAESFEAERFADAEKSLRDIAALVPTVPVVRELYGLTLYRVGKYRGAASQLEEFRVLAGSVEQNPVLADCYRAQKRWADVEVLWEELAQVSPGADLVTEGRIVAAGALADQGDVNGAVRFLEKGWQRPKRPKYHQLRRAYALADLYERAGNIPRARALFEWIVGHDPDFVDSRARVRNLR